MSRTTIVSPFGGLPTMTLTMVCDHVPAAGEPRCKAPVLFAPQINVPATDQAPPDHRLIRMMTTVHYCEQHWGELRIDEFLTDAMKRRFEDYARRARPLTFKCDFAAAFIVQVPIFSPAYKRFLRQIEIKADAQRQAAL